MIRIRNQRLRHTAVTVSGVTATPVSAHFEASVRTPWFRFGITYCRPAWIETQDRRIPVRDVTAMVRGLAVALALMVFIRRSNDD